MNVPTHGVRRLLRSILTSNKEQLNSFLRGEISAVETYNQAITKLRTSGPWGAFAKLIEGGAATVGEKVAIAALEEGEDHGLRDYKADVAKLDPEIRSFVEQRLLPEQQRTHAGLSTLKKQLH